MVDITEALKARSSPAVPAPVPVPTNDAVYQEAGDTGKRTLWSAKIQALQEQLPEQVLMISFRVVFVLMVLSSIAFYILAFRVPIQKRLFHIITAFITTFAAISYYAMAVGDGVYLNRIEIKETQKHVPDTITIIYREVYWARYVDWALTTPLLLLDLALLAGLAGGNILVAVVADVIMIVNGLFAALTNDSDHKWGYYAIAVIAYLVVIYQLAINGRAVAQAKDSKTGTFFAAIGGFTLVLWTFYPIIWGFADGSRTVDVNIEIILYAILDVLSKAVFGFWLLFTHDAYSSGTSLDGFWAHGLGKDGTIRVGDDDEGA